MLNADSSTLNSDNDVHRTVAAPIIPIAVALRWIERTARRMLSSEAPGRIRFSSVTKKLPSSAWPARPSSARASSSNGTNESSAKYAIIAERCVPRSAKNFATSVRFLSRIPPVSFRAGWTSPKRSPI
jgi:hypothetical protein